MSTSKKSLWGRVKKIFIILFIAQLLYIVLLRWVNPPFTITQIVSLVRGNGLKRDYVSYHAMSTDVKLAVMAGEDQLFPDHNGFDIKAIKPAVKYNKKHPAKVRGASTISQQNILIPPILNLALYFLLSFFVKHPNYLVKQTLFNYENPPNQI